MKSESDNHLAFQDVLLTRNPGGSSQRSIHRKPTFTLQYVDSQSFVSPKQNRNLDLNLTKRLRRICLEDAVESELRLIRNILKGDGYLERFIDRNMLPRPDRIANPTAEEMPVIICLPYKANQVCDFINRRLHTALRLVFLAAELKSRFTTEPLLWMSLRDK